MISITISGKARWTEGSLNLEILMGGEAQAVFEFQLEAKEGGGGGGKKCAFHCVDVDIFSGI